MVICFSGIPLWAGAISLEATLDRGETMVKTGRPAEALRQFQEARVEYPDSAELLFAIGCAPVSGGGSIGAPA